MVSKKVHPEKLFILIKAFISLVWYFISKMPFGFPNKCWWSVSGVFGNLPNIFDGTFPRKWFTVTLVQKSSIIDVWQGPKDVWRYLLEYIIISDTYWRRENWKKKQKKTKQNSYPKKSDGKHIRWNLLLGKFVRCWYAMLLKKTQYQLFPFEIFRNFWSRFFTEYRRKNALGSPVNHRYLKFFHFWKDASVNLIMCCTRSIIKT